MCSRLMPTVGCDRDRCSVCLDDGIKPVFERDDAQRPDGTITASHPLLTAQGWRPLAEVSVGEFIAVPTSIPVFGTDDLPDDRDRPACVSSRRRRSPPAAFRLPRLRLARVPECAPRWRQRGGARSSVGVS